MGSLRRNLYGRDVSNPDYARYAYIIADNHRRYRKRARNAGLVCQECSGAGEVDEGVFGDFAGPFLQCGWCCGGGFVTGFTRNLWLRYRRELRNAIPH